MRLRPASPQLIRASTSHRRVYAWPSEHLRAASPQIHRAPGALCATNSENRLQPASAQHVTSSITALKFVNLCESTTKKGTTRKTSSFPWFVTQHQHRQDSRKGKTETFSNINSMCISIISDGDTRAHQNEVEEVSFFLLKIFRYHFANSLCGA